MKLTFKSLKYLYLLFTLFISFNAFTKDFEINVDRLVIKDSKKLNRKQREYLRDFTIYGRTTRLSYYSH